MKAIRVKEDWQRAGVYYVRTQAMVQGFHVPLDKEFDEQDKEDSLYVLVLDGIYPVATCRIHLLEDEQKAKIERVCVLEGYRKKGVGRLLIEEAENWLLDKNIETVIITSRDEAVGFYEALGYKADYEKIYDTDVFKIIYTEKSLIRRA